MVRMRNVIDLHHSSSSSKMKLGSRQIQTCFFLIVTLIETVLSESLSNESKGSNSTAGEVSTAANFSTPASNSTEMAPTDSDNTGAVVAGCIIGFLAVVVLIVAVFVFKRRRESRMLDNEKKMQIQMSSARNAGVYQDLTVSVPLDEKPPASPEHERLKDSEDA